MRKVQRCTAHHADGIHGGILLTFTVSKEVNKIMMSLTNNNHQHSSQDGPFVLGALRVISNADAGHRHEKENHRRETQDRP